MDGHKGLPWLEPDYYEIRERGKRLRCAGTTQYWLYKGVTWECVPTRVHRPRRHIIWTVSRAA